YGEILDIQLVRDKKTGVSKGFAFLKYEDQRSTILAVDNLNNINLLGRTIRVDHASNQTKDGQRRTGMNAAPEIFKDDSESSASSEDEFADKVDPDDPMRDYLIKKLKKEKKRAKKRAKKEKKDKKEKKVRKDK
ncbi:14281_t:CDS:2, partial [Acaulospora colombiana]